MWLTLPALLALLSALMGYSVIHRHEQSSGKQVTLLPCGISLLQGRRAQVWHTAVKRYDSLQRKPSARISKGLAGSTALQHPKCSACGLVMWCVL